MKLLVTGGAGFIGSNFVRYILKKYREYRVVVLDKLTYAGNRENLKDLPKDRRLLFVKGDICNPATVDRLVKGCDAVVNFAAETHVDRSIMYGGDFVKTDVYGTFVLLEGVRKHGVKRFIQISTDEVYGEAGPAPSTEDSPLMPKSPYAASKAGGDRLAFACFTTYNSPVVITRCVNNYGPYQHPEKMIPLFTTNALMGLPLPVYGGGQNTREWVHVEDHCRALDLLLHADAVEGEVFNIGTGVERSVMDIARVILRETGAPPDLLSHVTDRPGHVARHAVDSGKLRARSGWEPLHQFEQGLGETVQWYRENPQWWGRVRKGEEFRRYYGKWYGKR